MTDKEKILAKVEFWLNETNYEPFTDEVFGKIQSLKELKSYIDSLQEEPIKIKKGCKYRCLSDMINKDTGNIAFIGGKIYLAPKDNTLVSEENGWRCDTSENASNFELIEEPVSEELEEVANKYGKDTFVNECMENGVCDNNDLADAFKAGAKWQQEQFEKDYANLCNGIVTAKGIAVAMAYDKGVAEAKEQMMSKAIRGRVSVNVESNYHSLIYGCWDMDNALINYNEGDKVKVIVIKEE